MSTARYLVAKYAPDLWRMEPRNIGVIVWSPSKTIARFVAERTANGELDGRRIPREVNNPNAYIQWVQYWRELCRQPELNPLSGGPSVPRTSPEFIEALKLTGRGNYLLEEGGVVLDEVNLDNLPDLAEYLFQMLVESKGRVGQVVPSRLERQCEEYIRLAHLDADPNFKRDLPLVCPMPDMSGINDPLIFSYGYQNGTLQRVYQRVELPSQADLVMRNVHNAVWMVKAAVQAQQIEPAQAVALVYLTKQKRTDPTVEQLLGVLNAVVPKVIDVAEQVTALREFQELAQAGHN